MGAEQSAILGAALTHKCGGRPDAPRRVFRHPPGMSSPLPASSAASEPLALRVLRLVLLFGLALILILFGSLAVLSFSSTLHDGFANVFFSNSGRPLFQLPSNIEVNAVVLTAIVLTPLFSLVLPSRWRLRSWRLLLTLPIGVLLFAGWHVLPQSIDGRSAAGLLVLGLMLLIVGLALFVVLRLRKRSWWWVGGGYLAAAPVLMYLVVDDPMLRHPVSADEIALAFPGAEKSFEVLMRYGKEHPLGRDFKAPQRFFQRGQPKFAPDPTKAEEWRAWLLASRTNIEAGWADLAPVRAWWIELNAFDRIGDLTPSRFDAEIIAFSPMRSYSQHAIAIAGLQALDGQGDAAFETLLPLLEVSRKLEPSARTIVRFMIARVVQRMAIQTAGFVLDHTTVSAAMRDRFAIALTGGFGGEAGARRLIGVEYSFGLGTLLDLRLGDYIGMTANNRPGSYKFLSQPVPRQLLNWLSPFVYNPRKTLNLYGDLTEQLQDIAARRELEKNDPTHMAFFDREARPHFKNAVGPILLFGTVPAYSRIIEAYWKTEDARAALRERLVTM
jgi:hypothetical protein